MNQAARMGIGRRSSPACGAPGSPAGSTAITAAFNAWNGDTNSNTNHVYLKADSSGLHNGGTVTRDFQNTIAFERDLMSEYGVPPFSCSGSSYSGTLGVGGIFTQGTHSGPNGETFATAVEGDVEMNQGIANCAFPGFFTGDFVSALTLKAVHFQEIRTRVK
jgi:hypothetical protein